MKEENQLEKELMKPTENIRFGFGSFLYGGIAKYVGILDGDKMTIKNRIRKSLGAILVASPLIAGGLGLSGEYIRYTRGSDVVKKLGWEANTSGSVIYSLLANGNILARQHFISKFGMFAPSTYEISPENSRYQQIFQSIRK